MITFDPLLELPFDQYQRYRVASDLLSALCVAPGSRVVDVGGAPGRIEDFLPDHETFVVDLEGPFHGQFVIGSGASLPFPDQAFAAAVALDTLEHVPPELRERFLDELRRVADMVVISAPFANLHVELAEAALHEFVTQRFAGDFPTLEEHSVHGLPDLETTMKQFEVAGWPAATLPSGYLPRWLGGMLLHHELLATGLPDLHRLHAYYNATVSPLDCREPAYRHVVVAARGLPAAALEEAVTSLRVDADTGEAEMTLHSIASAVFAQRLGGVMRSGEIAALREELGSFTSRVHDLERELADRDAHLIEVGAQNDALRAEVDELRRSLLDAQISLTKRLARRMSSRRDGSTK